MKRGSVSLCGEIEHRGIRKLLNFQPDATQHGVDVERTLPRPTIPSHSDTWCKEPSRQLLRKSHIYCGREG
jgi:hypothetical protein